MAVVPERPPLVLVRAEADAPPVPDVSLWRVLRIAGLLLALGPVVLAGLALAVWVVWQVALWVLLVAGA